MKNSSFTLEHALYTLALVVAVGVRFLNLNLLPLSDYEAGWALQALHVAQGLRPVLDSNPAYIHLTAILFFIFGSTEFLARFWPAAAGSLLVILPFFFRDRLGRVPALILAFGLALDPGLTALSRLAGSSTLAIATLLLTWAMWRQHHPRFAGVFAGLALLSGPAAWFGLLGLVLSSVIASWLQGNQAAQETEDKSTSKKDRPDTSPATFRWEVVRTPLGWGAGTVLVVGSLLLLSPNGLSAMVASVWTFLHGWWTFSNTSALHLLISLPVYEVLPLAFGLAAVVRGIEMRDSLSIRLGVWALVALLLALIYPSKQVADLAWVILPLWTLAGLELSRHLDVVGCNYWGLAGVILVVVVLVVYGWLNLASLTTVDLASKDATPHLYMVGIAILLIGVILLLVGTGWSADLARLGGVWAAGILLGAYTLGVMTGTAGLRQPLTEEFWQPEPRIAGSDLLLETANQISNWNKGAFSSLQVTISGVNSPELLWLFRNWQVHSVDSLASGASPELVITVANVQLSLTQGYRGEGFAWWETTNWNSAAAANWLNWVVYHQMPVHHDYIVLWVRGDLVIENQGQPAVP